MDTGQPDRVRDYYARDPEREWQRLESSTDGALEYTLTCDALASYLPKTGRVLDLGCGPGRYSIWLAEQGFRVTLADLSPELLDVARREIITAGVHEQVDEAVTADARDLSVWDSAVFDAIVCLGPFYHLQSEAERDKAASEIARVLSPGGVLFASFMPRYAFLRRVLSIPDERELVRDPEFLDAILRKGRFNNPLPGRFTGGYGVVPSEIEPSFAKHGFQKLDLLSTESVFPDLQGELMSLRDLDYTAFSHILSAAKQIARDSSIFGTANHLLYVGTRK